MPKMLDGLPPLMRPRMSEVGKPEGRMALGSAGSIDPELRKFAMLLLGTLKFPKLWNRFGPPPGLVPPVMSYCVFPAGGVGERVTCVLSPDDVMGEAACTREGGYGTATTTDQLNRREYLTLAWYAARCLNGTPSFGIVVHPARSGYFNLP